MAALAELADGAASDSEEERPQLSEHALAALREFYSDQEERQRLFQARAAEGAGAGGVAIEEDWNLSQFWYDDETALTLAQEALNGGSKRIACVSCPTVYAKLLQIKPADCEIVLLEYDRRFEIYGENFVFYDYTKPLVLPQKLEEKSFDVVIADPPYLSQECLQKTADTVSFLAKAKLILCTGKVMEGLASKLLSLKICSFLPQHTRNLANDFRCFVNYESKSLNPT